MIHERPARRECQGNPGRPGGAEIGRARDRAPDPTVDALALGIRARRGARCAEGPALTTPETRALLLTDVVDSTKLAEKLGDQRMVELWTAHDRVARDLLVPHRGREIDKTDGFLLIFD